MSSSGRRCLGVDLGVAGGADAEPRCGLAAADERGELGRAPESAGGRREVGLAPRGIAAQREDVLDPRIGEPVEDGVEAVGRLADDAQVGHRLDPVVALDPRRDLDGPLAGRAAGAVGDRDEARLEPVQVLDALEQRRDALVGLRREELEGEARLAAVGGRFDQLGDSHARNRRTWANSSSRVRACPQPNTRPNTGTRRRGPRRSIFFPEGAYGPTNNCIGIADVLRRRGWRVVFIAEESFEGTFVEKGFEERLMRLGPKPEQEEDPGPVLEGLHPRDGARLPRAHDRAARGIHRADLRGADRGRPLRRRAPRRDHRRGPARRDRRGQRRLVPGPAGERRSLGPDRVLQPRRGQGSRGPAGLLRLSRRRPHRLGTVPRGVRAGDPAAARFVQRVLRRARGPAVAAARARPRLPRPQPLALSAGGRLPPRRPALGHLAQPRLLRPIDRRGVVAARRVHGAAIAPSTRSSTSASARWAPATSS